MKIKKKSLKEIEAVESCILNFSDDISTINELFSHLKKIKRSTQSSEAVILVIEAINSNTNSKDALKTAKKFADMAQDSYPFNAIGDLVLLLSTDPKTKIINQKIYKKLSYLRRKTTNPRFAIDLLLNSEDKELRILINEASSKLDEFFSNIPKFRTSKIIYFAKELMKK